MLYSCSLHGEGLGSWKHSTGTIDADFVSKYILNDIASYVTENSVLLHDGASVHTAEVSVDANMVFQGRSVKVASHSHDFSPVERGFAKIWKFIRKNFNRSIHTSQDVLEAALQHYAIGAPGAAKAG